MNDLLAKVGLAGDIEDAAIIPIPNSESEQELEFGRIFITKWKGTTILV